MAGVSAIDAFRGAPSRGGCARASGFTLLEVLVALILFSVGVLGLVGLQTASIKQAGQAEFRSLAALQANEVVARMWGSDRTAATLQSSFASPNGAQYLTWLADVQASGLPGISSANGTLPTITFTTLSGGGTSASSSTATVSVFWLGPGDTAAHTFVLVANLK